MSLFPKAEYKSAYDVPYEYFYDKGYRGAIFDIDNTLVLHDAPADEKSKALFIKLKTMGMKTAIISNNEEPRVREFSEAVGSNVYVYKAGKPGKGGYLKAIEQMGVPKEKVIFTGDQIFTDILGANRAEVFSILAGRIGPEKYFHIILKRILEAPVKLAYHIYTGIIHKH